MPSTLPSPSLEAEEFNLDDFNIKIDPELRKLGNELESLSSEALGARIVEATREEVRRNISPDSPLNLVAAFGPRAGEFISKEPKLSELEIGRLLAAEQDYKAAIEFLCRAVIKNPQEAHFEIGRVFIEMNDFLKAETYLKKASEIGHPSADALLGIVYEAQNKEPLAEAMFQSASLKGVNKAHKLLGNLRIKQGNWADAKNHYGQLIEKDAYVLLNEGVIAIQEGKTGEACDYFLSTLLQAKNDFVKEKAHHYLAHLYAIEGKIDPALDHFEKEFEISGSESVLLSILQMLHSRGDMERIIEIAESMPMTKNPTLAQVKLIIREVKQELAGKKPALD